MRVRRMNPDIFWERPCSHSGATWTWNSRALALALIQFGEETGSKIVAEGVETLSQLDVLRQLKVSKAQGFLLGRPMPFESLQTRL